ncbi:MAG: sirohydrochlorin cobaltochelatase [Deltaproteobacteria bacterium]|jgi:cobalamin biosynthesis Co2+ chelatase CbiK|nr:sirohydrochlorin cobaltochelatase [Deltaproteobacteria bacterium]
MLVILLNILLLLFFSTKLHAQQEIQRPAIVLVTPGPIDPNDLKGLTCLENEVRSAFPCYEVHVAFTSAEARQVWNKRAQDLNFKKYFPWVEERYYHVKNPLTILALIQEEGPRLVLVQPLELVDGEEFHDILAVVDALRKIKAFDRVNVPFPYIGLGNPAMGIGDGQKENHFIMANVFKPIFEEAKENEANVVFITDTKGEANTIVYRTFADVLSTVYDTKVFIGVPHTKFGSKHVLEDMDTALPPPGKILLGSLSFYLTDETKVELFGASDDSWSSVFINKGYEVIPYTVPLSTSKKYAEVFINSLKKMEETVSRRYTD